MTDQPPTQQPPVPGPTPGYPPYPPYAYSPPVNMYAILALVFGAMVFPPLASGIQTGWLVIDGDEGRVRPACEDVIS
ncbi:MULTISPECIES: hypothetical protein [unclassified Micromonospora]|uniref:hypothetical protein n=1 Tax=unclassified Micromonospora TaxID=2617518 RepID=UPI0033AFD064